jgi:hypothetical protein
MLKDCGVACTSYVVATTRNPSQILPKQFYGIVRRVSISASGVALLLIDLFFSVLVRSHISNLLLEVLFSTVPFYRICVCESIMLNAIVQFIRNLLCCIKDTQYGKQPENHMLSWLYNSTITNQFFADTLDIKLVTPLNVTTPLEAMISVAQLYVVLTGVPDAISNFRTSYQQLNRAYRLIQTRQKTVVTTHAERLVHASLMQEAHTSLRSMFIAFNCFFISVAFIWLSANSWHITSTDWIGGLPALIQALFVMNACLTPLLYYMYLDASEYIRKALRIKLLYKKLQSGTVTDADIGISALLAVSNNEWVPFWSARCSGSNYVKFRGLNEDIQLLADEILKVQTMLDDMTGATSAKKKADDVAAMNKLRDQIQKDVATAIQPMIAITRWEGYREYIYFVLNTVAWYGYGMCIVVYYWPKVLQQPDWIRILLLYFDNDDADWYGNFAGDLMWTVEPMIILSSPILINLFLRRRPSSQKLKTE